MSDVIEWVLELRVTSKDGLQELLDEMVQATQANEPGALHYEYYMPEDRSTCTVLERYADSAAAMTHVQNWGANFAERFMQAFAVERFTVFGPAGDDLKAALSGFGATHQERVAGFNR
jgi:quinol monooxygenase YgiN